MVASKTKNRGFRLFFKNNFPTATKVNLVLWAVLALAATSIGLVLVYFSFREGLDMADGSTFYQFAHNIASGEAIYKDFIHFRTPGSYFLQAGFLTLFGDEQNSLRFALGFEARVLYTFIFVAAIAIFLRFKHILIGLSATTLMLMLPAYAQLRTVLAFLAVVLYVQSYRTLGRKAGWLVGAGIATGLAFTFGQEAAVLAISVIGVTEIAMQLKDKTYRDIKVSLRRIGFLALGFIIGIAPLLTYVLLKSDIGNFLYYTIYYAFVLQPQGMNLPFPVFEYANFLFYLPFILILISFYVFFRRREKVGIAGIVLLAFVCVRLVTLLGRSDMGHLLFVLPELLFLSVMTIYYSRSIMLDKSEFLRFLPWGVALSAVFYTAINASSLAIVVAVPIIAAALLMKLAKRGPNKITHTPTVLISAAFAITLFILFPSLVGTTHITTRGLTAMSIGGVNVNEPLYSETNDVIDAVKPLNPTTIFSYPIQPFFYSLAPEHAARFMTFEPQTTEHEQDLTIEDLKRTQPEVVIFDPAQASALSKALWKINDYITTNYEVHQVLTGTRIMWVMTKKEDVVQELSYLAYGLYKKDHYFTEGTAFAIHSPDKLINSGVAQNPNTAATFAIDPEDNQTTLRLSIYKDPASSKKVCGEVKIVGEQTKDTTVCSEDGRVNLVLGDKVKQIVFMNKSSELLIWNDPVLVGPLSE